jgi:hypothetical protein
LSRNLMPLVVRPSRTSRQGMILLLSIGTVPGQEVFQDCQPEAAMVLGVTEHGIRFPSALAWRNLVATQFHPEKSGRFGLKILENFLAWDASDVK